MSVSRIARRTMRHCMRCDHRHYNYSGKSKSTNISTNATTKNVNTKPLSSEAVIIMMVILLLFIILCFAFPVLWIFLILFILACFKH